MSTAARSANLPPMTPQNTPNASPASGRPTSPLAHLPRLAAHVGLLAATTLLPAAASVARLAAPPLSTPSAPALSLVATTSRTARSMHARALLEPSSARFGPALERALSRVPESVIDGVRDRGTRIWVVPSGTRHLPAALLTEDGQPLVDVARDWRRWQADPNAVHGLMSMPDHRAAFISPDGEVSVPDAVTGQSVPYGKIATLRDLAVRWGTSLYGTDATTLPRDLNALENLLLVMNPDIASTTAPLPRGLELRLPTSVPYQGHAYAVSSMTLVAEINSTLAQGRSVQDFPFSNLIAVPEEALTPSTAHPVVEIMGRQLIRLIDEDARFGFNHASELAALASDAETRGQIDGELADPVAFYAHAFAKTFSASAESASRTDDAAVWAPTQALIRRDLQWLAQRPAHPPTPATPAPEDTPLSAPVTCPSVPGPDSPVRTEMLDAATLRGRHARNTATLAQMTDADSWTRHSDAIVHDLGIVPPGLLEKAKQEGVRIYVLPEGATQVPARLFAEDAAVPQPEARAVAVARADAFTLNGTDPIDAPPRDRQTLADVARARGAATPAEIDLFVAQASSLNTLRPDAPLTAGQSVRLPDLHFYQDQRYTAQTLRDIEQMNRSITSSAGFFRFWEDGRFRPVLVVKEKHLCERKDQASQKRVLLHELGHVAEFLALHDPATRADHEAAMRAIRASAARNPSEMLTTYARVHPAEQYADAFEAWFTADRPGLPITAEQANEAALRAANPRLLERIEADLARYDR